MQLYAVAHGNHYFAADVVETVFRRLKLRWRLVWKGGLCSLGPRGARYTQDRDQNCASVANNCENTSQQFGIIGKSEIR